MKKVISTIEKEISKIKEDLNKYKEIISGSIDNIAVYSSAIKGVEPKLEELNKLDKVLEFVKNIQSLPNETQQSKRGRPKKNS